MNDDVFFRTADLFIKALIAGSVLAIAIVLRMMQLGL